MKTVHLVAHAIPGTYPLSTPDACWRLWRALRRAVPKVLAAYLMPNHLHLIVTVLDADELRRRVTHVLSGFARAAGARTMWIRVPEPVVISDPGKLARQVRYALLNGTRAGYYDDPACSTWSTYRDTIGATLDPWVDVAELAAALGRRLDGFVEWFHGYVSGDPSVQVGGTPRPVPAPQRAHCATPLDVVAAAAAAVAATALGTDRRRAGLERHAYVLAARHQGWNSAAEIAAHTGVATDTVRRLARTPDDALLAATALYLGDARLLAPQRFRREV